MELSLDAEIAEILKEDTGIKPKLRVDVNNNKTKKGVKVQFILPSGVEGTQKSSLEAKLKTKLNTGLATYGLSVDSDTDTPYKNVIGFTIYLPQIKLLIQKILSGNDRNTQNP